MNKKEKPFRIAVAGLGTVGGGLLELLEQNTQPIEVVAVAVKDKNKKRPIDITKYQLFDSAESMAQSADYDGLVELMGGIDTAGDVWQAAIERGKTIITANKALLAERAGEFIPLIEKNQSQIYFEAAVMGGVPIIDNMKNSLRSIQLTGFHGIVNGTCNYILSSMAKKNINFDEALKEAQAAGYAEADPTFDIEGIDALHKLTILTLLGFQTSPDMKKIRTVGITAIDKIDIQYAKLFGYKIKLLAVAKKIHDELLLSVAPMLISNDTIMAKVGGALNAINLHSTDRGPVLLIGAGAGGLPTASAVLSDILLARKNQGQENHYPFCLPFGEILKSKTHISNDMTGRFYIRLEVDDKVGVLANFSSILRDENISIEKIHQNDDKPVHIAIITHHASLSAVMKGVEKLAAADAVLSKPLLLQILDK